MRIMSNNMGINLASAVAQARAAWHRSCTIATNKHRSTRIDYVFTAGMKPQSMTGWRPKEVST